MQWILLLQILKPLTYDDNVLAFPAMVQDHLVPAAAPWLFLNTLRSGYLSGCSKDGLGYCLYIDDNFQEQPLQLLIYTDEATTPIRAEIIYNDRRILTIDIKNFILQ